MLRALLITYLLQLRPASTTPTIASGSSTTPLETVDERERGVDAQNPSEPQKKRGPTLHGGEPEFEPSEDEDDLDEDIPEFPATHELTMKDHTKVISALALDPSGARVVSGSYDYDCKLWDFGGMDHRCKPFKSWEPAGSYYVSISPGSLQYYRRGFIFFWLQ